LHSRYPENSLSTSSMGSTWAPWGVGERAGRPVTSRTPAAAPLQRSKQRRSLRFTAGHSRRQDSRGPRDARSGMGLPLAQPPSECSVRPRTRMQALTLTRTPARAHMLADTSSQAHAHRHACTNTRARTEPLRPPGQVEELAKYIAKLTTLMRPKLPRSAWSTFPATAAFAASTALPASNRSECCPQAHSDSCQTTCNGRRAADDLQ
jgi:hypothetical protein